LTELLNQAYAGYLVPIRFTPVAVSRTLGIHGIDLDSSRVACCGSAAIGIGLLSHRGWTTRLAAMGIVPEFRHAGVGRWLLDRLLAEGRQHGDRRITLEVIEDNTPAVRLYESAGFTARRRLLGYIGDHVSAAASDPPEEVDVPEVAREVVRWGLPDLPWQVSGETLAHHSLPVVGFRLGDAFAVIEPKETRVELLSLIVRPEARRRGAATRLLRALFAHYPGKDWRIAPRLPEEIPASLFTRLGFVPDRISQKQMFMKLV
jgi:ribosomal protein S18 acetylase RimI-like enzyme